MSPENSRMVLQEIRDKMNIVRSDSRTILNVPGDLQTLATAVHNMSIIVEELVDDQAK